MSRSRTRTLLATATVVLLIVALSAVADASPARGTITTIRGIGGSLYTSSHWSPRRVSIEEGSRVRWRSVSFDHVLAAYGGNWTFHHSLPEGTSVRKRFPDAGTYLFRCRIHSTLVNGDCQGMCGKIVVH